MPKCTYCEEAPELSIIQANEPWHDTHYYCKDCDSTYPIWEFDNVKKEIADIRTATATACKSKNSALKFLKDAGILQTLKKPDQIDYDWVVIGSDGKELAYKKPGEDPVFIDAEAAVIKAIEIIKEMQTTQLHTSHILADLSRFMK